MRIAVTGASGLVGRAIVERLGATGLSHRDLDITDAAAVQRTVGGYDLVVNCAVIGVDECERDRALAHAVNVAGPANLARAAKSVLHFSSNYVFDGREEKFYAVDDDARPVNEYGRTKLEGERAVLQLNRNAFVIRSSWIFGPGKDSFISTVHRACARASAFARWRTCGRAQRMCKIWSTASRRSSSAANSDCTMWSTVASARMRRSHSRPRASWAQIHNW